MRTKYKRKFTGIWIPAKIWLRKDLCPNEKFLLCEINSLDDEENGCFASNEYFADLLGVTVQRIQQILRHLRKKSLIKIQISNNGKRILKDISQVKRQNRPHSKDITNYIGRYNELYPSDITNYIPKSGEFVYKKKGKNPMGYNSIYNNIENKKNIKKETFISFFPKHFQEDMNFQKTWNEWEQYRKEIKHKLTKSSVVRQINFLTQFSISEAIQSIEQSIMRGYRGLFPINKNFFSSNISTCIEKTENILHQTIQDITYKKFDFYKWKDLLDLHKKYYEFLSSILNGKYKYFLDNRMSNFEEMLKRFSSFISKNYSNFVSLEPYMLKPTGKIFQKFLAEEFQKNNIPISLLNKKEE